MKCTVHSQHGSIMVIPREEGMVRLYIQLASSSDSDWDPSKRATEAQVQESAKRILRPYSIDWQRIEWFSTYPIGQGISEEYTLDQRVFLGGDACHTHSVRHIFLPWQRNQVCCELLLLTLPFSPCRSSPKRDRA